MICSKRVICASEEGLHLADVGHFRVDEFLGQVLDLAVMLAPVMHILQPLDHATGIAQNHHVCDFGIGMAVA